jgi:Kinase binding protein CGI-121
MALEATAVPTADGVPQTADAEEKHHITSAPVASHHIASSNIAPPSSSSHFLLHGGSHADIFLYTKVSNMRELLSLFQRQQLQAAVLNASLLCDVFPVLCALVKTTQQARRNQLKSKSAHQTRS